jgi:chemotaxis protein methyltransferase CheR
MTPGPAAEVDDIEASLVVTALKERWGYDFTGYSLPALKRRLAQIAASRGSARVAELISPILHDPDGAAAIINGISVPASEFFRDPLVWKFVREELARHLSSFPRINVWQAGCGRGEETYTLAILLNEAGLGNRVRILATDFNADLLAAGRLGRWDARSLDHWHDNYLASGGAADFAGYFVRDGDGVAIREDIRSSVKFMQHNLVSDDVFMEAQFVVCRNVMIYFSDALQAKGLGLFYRSLQRGGFLLIGQSETLLDVTGKLSAFRCVNDAHRVYQKPIRNRQCSL